MEFDKILKYIYLWTFFFFFFYKWWSHFKYLCFSFFLFLSFPFFLFFISRVKYDLYKLECRKKFLCWKLFYSYSFFSRRPFTVTFKKPISIAVGYFWGRGGEEKEKKKRRKKRIIIERMKISSYCKKIRNFHPFDFISFYYIFLKLLWKRFIILFHYLWILIDTNFPPNLERSIGETWWIKNQYYIALSHGNFLNKKKKKKKTFNLKLPSYILIHYKLVVRFIFLEKTKIYNSRNKNYSPWNNQKRIN